MQRLLAGKAEYAKERTTALRRLDLRVLPQILLYTSGVPHYSLPACFLPFYARPSG